MGEGMHCHHGWLGEKIKEIEKSIFGE